MGARLSFIYMKGDIFLVNGRGLTPGQDSIFAKKARIHRIFSGKTGKNALSGIPGFV